MGLFDLFKRKKIDKLLSQMNELHSLPLGVAEFHEWSDRIIASAMLPADAQSQKFALAEMIMHIKPTEDHCNDGFFIKSLRKGAANQVAHAMMMSIRDEAKARLAAQEAEKALHVVDTKEDKSTDAKILAND